MSRWHICAWLAVTAFCAVILGSGTGAHGASEVEIRGDLAPWPNSSPPTPEEAFGEVELRGMAWAEMVDGEVEVEGLRPYETYDLAVFYPPFSQATKDVLCTFDTDEEGEGRCWFSDAPLAHGRVRDIGAINVQDDSGPPWSAGVLTSRYEWGGVFEKDIEDEGILRVGALFPFTGVLADFGPSWQNAAELAAEHVNEAGGVVGQDIEIVPGDTATTPEVGVQEALRLIDEEGISAIVGAGSSWVTAAVAENATIPNGMLQISPASTSPTLTTLEDDDLLFRTALSDAAEGIILAELAQELGYETASTLYINNPYGRGVSETFAARFEELGGEVLATVPHEADQATYLPELEEATVDDPDVLAAISYPHQAIVYLNEAITYGLIGEFLFVGGTKYQDMIDAVGAEHLNGMYGTAGAEVDSPAGDAFDAAYEDEYGEPPWLPFMRQAYDAVVLIALAAEVAGSVEPEEIRDALRWVANPPGEVVGLGADGIEHALDLVRAGEDVSYEGASGAVDFDANGDVTSGAIEIWRIDDGHIVTVRIEEVVLE